MSVNCRSGSLPPDPLESSFTLLVSFFPVVVLLLFTRWLNARTFVRGLTIFKKKPPFLYIFLKIMQLFPFQLIFFKTLKISSITKTISIFIYLVYFPISFINLYGIYFIFLLFMPVSKLLCIFMNLEIKY